MATTSTSKTFTPVFDLTFDSTNPARRTSTGMPSIPSSSLLSTSSSSQAQGSRPPPPVLPYITRLSRMHHALCNLPFELAPSSRESSPTDHARVNVLKRKIAEVVQSHGGGRTITRDLFYLKCTRRRTRTVARAPSRRHAPDSLSLKLDVDDYILPDTEEEWFAWEKKMEAKRLKVKQNSNSKPKSTGSKAKAKLAKAKTVAVGKVLSSSTTSGKRVQAMDSPSAVAVVPAARETSPQPQPQPTSSPLGFPVVKRVSSNSKMKGKPESKSRTTTTNGKKPSQPPDLEDHDMEVDVPEALTVTARPRSPMPENSPQAEDDQEQQPERVDAFPPISELPDTSDFPQPSFPPTLLTSTPRPPKIFEPDTPEDVAPGRLEKKDTSSETQASHLSPSQQPPPSMPSQLESITPLSPPTPPMSTREASPEERPVDPAPVSQTINPSLLVHTRGEMVEAAMEDVEGLRPLPVTPISASDGHDHNEPRVLVPNSNSTSPHTPDAHSTLTKGPRHLPRHLQHAQTLTPTTPQPQLQSPGAGVPSPSPSVLPVLGNAKGLPLSLSFPQTPDRERLPHLMDLLATSRRSAKRPRPPSRKSTSPTKSQAGEEREGAEPETEPAPSAPYPATRKLFFSSPASGSTGTPGSTVHVPDSPLTPLAGFTQHPSRFNPMAQSTQQVPSPLGLPHNQHVASSQSGDALYSGYFKRMGTSQPFKGNGIGGGTMASQNGNSVLSRAGSGAGSGLMGMSYSSQYDFEGRMDDVSKFMEKDVDFGAWVKDLDVEDEDGEDEDEEVNQMTQPDPASTVSSPGSVHR